MAQVDDFIRKCAAFLGEPSGGTFLVHGTGFFVFVREGEHDFTYFVSARHVVWPGRGVGPDVLPEGTISIRMNREVGAPKEIPTVRKEWIFPANKYLDICAYLFDDNAHQSDGELDYAKMNALGMFMLSHADKQKLGIPQGVPHYEVSLGEEVFVTGAFISRIGERKNIPIVRIGTIAAMPEEPVEFFSPTKPAYLVEIRSLGGLSGSPVLLNLRRHTETPGVRHRQILGVLSPADMEKRGEATTIIPYILVGMVLGAHSSSDYMKDFVESDDGSAKLTDVDLNSGICVVMPASQIVDFLFEPERRQERTEAIARRRKLVGYHGA
jgi:hypothetical protein